MKALPPRNECRERPSRSSPSTELIGVGVSTLRHVAVLAGLRGPIVAREPFLVGRLLGQFADDLAVGPQARG